MNASGFGGWLATVVGLLGVYAIFYNALASPYLGMDETMKKLGRIAVGVVIAMVLILATVGLLFGGAGAGVSTIGIIHFAIGVIILILVLAVLNWVIGRFLADIGAGEKNLVQFVIGGIALIAILLLASDALFGYMGWGLNRPLWSGSPVLR